MGNRRASSLITTPPPLLTPGFSPSALFAAEGRGRRAKELKGKWEGRSHAGRGQKEGREENFPYFISRLRKLTSKALLSLLSLKRKWRKLPAPHVSRKTEGLWRSAKLPVLPQFLDPYTKLGTRSIFSWFQAIPFERPAEHMKIL